MTNEKTNNDKNKDNYILNITILSKLAIDNTCEWQRKIIQPDPALCVMLFCNELLTT